MTTQIASGQCSRCNKRVMVWGNLGKQLCMSCDELLYPEAKA